MDGGLADEVAAEVDGAMEEGVGMVVESRRGGEFRW